jgi:hypothetical protein
VCAKCVYGRGGAAADPHHKEGHCAAGACCLLLLLLFAPSYMRVADLPGGGGEGLNAWVACQNTCHVRWVQHALHIQRIELICDAYLS